MVSICRYRMYIHKEQRKKIKYLSYKKENTESTVQHEKNVKRRRDSRTEKGESSQKK